MTRRELSAELLKFNSQEVPAVHDLGWALDVGMKPTQEQVVDAIFSLERLAEAYPAYATVYRRLLSGIDRHLSAGLNIANNPLESQGALCDEVDIHDNPGEPQDSEPVQVDVKKLLPGGAVEVADFVQEGTRYDFATCDHHELPAAVQAQAAQAEAQLTAGASAVAFNPRSQEAEAAVRQQLMLVDEGPLPPPWARYAETFNYLEAPPPWAQAERAEIVSIAPEARYSERRFVANPLPVEISRALQKQLPSDMQKFPGYLLGSNPKLAKGGEMCWLSAGLSMSPWTVAGLTNMCPFASKGCATGCLNISGQAEMALSMKVNKIIAARIFKTKLHLQYPEVFMKFLEYEIERWQAYASMPSASWPYGLKKDLKWKAGDSACSGHYGLSIRMNVLSDRPWEHLKYTWSNGQVGTVMERYPEIQFYDYTKWPSRMAAFLRRDEPNGDFPKNYWLTFSWSEINAPVAFQVLDHGGNVAVSFDTKRGRKLPAEFCGYPVIDADETDFRFLDNKLFKAIRKRYGTGMICGLRLKGHKHRRDFARGLAAEADLPVSRVADSRGVFTGGFTQYSEDCGMVDGKQVGNNITNEAWYKERLIEKSLEREAEQKQDPDKKMRFKGTVGWHWGA